MIDKKLLLANSAIFSMLSGQAVFKLIDPTRPELGFVGQLFDPTLTDIDAVFNLILFKERLQHNAQGVSFWEHYLPKTSRYARRYLRVSLLVISR